jgi:NADPH-dependent glutamate synthase beta subunit-like oxidoreductase/ferredoxin
MARASGKIENRLTPGYRPRQAEKRPPCQEACPNCGDIRGWIGLVAQRDKLGLSEHEAFAQAWSRITEVNPFPSVLGRVCPHPCEAGCNRAENDEPLAINAMERFLGDWAIDQGLPLPRLAEEPQYEWIGVIGAGPSGLSFAYQMARRGYRVTVYEGREKPGGMLRYGVPDFRLPQACLDAEIQRILDMGVDLQLNTRIGRDISLEALRARHAALYLGLGAQGGRKLGIPGEEGPSVWTGTEYLERVNTGQAVDVGQHVLVIGGGNSAIDAARSARRQGAEVTIVYRRSRDEMPAIPLEIEEALEEGIRLEVLTAPVSVNRDEGGALVGLVVERMALGKPDASGRPRPEPVPGSGFEMAADTIITAVSQMPQLQGFDALRHMGDWLVTDEAGQVGEGVLAGGDALHLGIAGNAIVQGRYAAERLHAQLRGQAGTGGERDQRAPITPEAVDFTFKPATEAMHASRLEGPERVARGNVEYAATVSAEQFLAEVQRCYSCGACMGCGQCEMFCTAGCFTQLEEVGQGMYFSLMTDACEECGKCIEVCPCGFLEATP